MQELWDKTFANLDAVDVEKRHQTMDEELGCVLLQF